MTAANKTVQIGLLGLGNIGGGVWNLLLDFAEELTARSGLRLRVKRALVLDKAVHGGHDVPDEVLTTEVDEILSDPEISIVCEFLGGEEPAAGYMRRALEAGKTVVTANKVALALHWHELESAAEASGAGLYFEASVCGAIPIINALRGPLQSSDITTLMGIVNGTTNYILTRMSREGEDYAAVLKDAQRLGLAEPNPTADVEGWDAAYKLSILASLAFHGRVPFGAVYREGITGVTAFDIACGREMGYTLKLLAIARRNGDKIEARVHPAFLPDSHPLAMVNGSFNAVYLQGHACKEMMFQGRGAGDAPTASAIVADILSAAAAEKHPRPDFPVTAETDPRFTVTDNWLTRYYIRFQAQDRPGVLKELAGCLAAEGVSIQSMVQKNAASDGWVPLVLITHEAPEQAVQQALRQLDLAVCRVESLLRVEG